MRPPLKNSKYWNLFSLMVGTFAILQLLNMFFYDIVPARGVGLWAFAYCQAILLFVFSIAACCYMLLATRHTGLWFGTLGFVIVFFAIIVGFGSTYHGLATLTETGCFTNSSEPITSIPYLAVVTLSTLGYGDISPIGACRVIAATEALVGVFVLPMLVAFFVSAVSKIDEADRATEASKDMNAPPSR